MGSHLQLDENNSPRFRDFAMNPRETIQNVIERHGERVFLVDVLSGKEITYAQFHRKASALAAHLRQRGIRKGDRIAVMLPNSCELAELYFACIYLGAVIVPINPSLNRNEVQFILSSCNPALVVTNRSHAETVREFHKNILLLVTEVESVDSVIGAQAVSPDLLVDAPDFVPLESSTADDRIVIMYTSGTSAKPKGLAHKLGSMFRNATAFASAQGIDHNSRFYLTLSMAYMGGFYNLLLLPFLCGASIVVDHVFDARSSLNFWDKAKTNQANTLWMAPTVLSILLRMDRGRAGEEFCRSAIRHAFVGFAPLPLKVKNEFESRYGVRLIENYGLSETLFVTARSRENIGGNGYVGEPVPGVALRIANDEGESMPSGADGEIQILTPDLMAGYLDSEGRLLETDSILWFSTGDVGHVDANGSLSITGRKKDLIIRGGVNISPAAIEEALMQCPGVIEVAVVSIPHELYGEDIVAVLKLEPGIELDHILDTVVSHAKLNLAPHQQPARYIAIDNLPRTSNGKVQKARIRELVAQKLQLSTRSSTKPLPHASSIAS
jgi:long-chain acyl-CoA synthetase